MKNKQERLQEQYDFHIMKAVKIQRRAARLGLVLRSGTDGVPIVDSGDDSPVDNTGCGGGCCCPVEHDDPRDQ